MDLAFWRDSISEVEREVIERGGYGKKNKLGERPALILVDLQYNYVGEDKPILEQIDRFPSGAGEAAWRALERTAELIPAARGANAPFVYTVVRRKSVVIDGVETSWAMTGGLVRSAGFMSESDPNAKIVAGYEPDPSAGDVEMEKLYASAFFGTALASYLVRRGIDTVLLVGGTTSGCIRSSAVDAYQLGFNVGIVGDCVFDRIPSSHMSSLLDVQMKYGTVLTCDEAVGYLEGLG